MTMHWIGGWGGRPNMVNFMAKPFLLQTLRTGFNRKSESTPRPRLTVFHRKKGDGKNKPRAAPAPKGQGRQNATEDTQPAPTRDRTIRNALSYAPTGLHHHRRSPPASRHMDGRASTRARLSQ